MRMGRNIIIGCGIACAMGMVIGCGEKTVSPTPPNPVLVTPANGEQHVLATDYLRWTQSSDFTWGKAMGGTVYPVTYHIQVANNAVFHDWTRDSTGDATDSIKCEIDGLVDTALSVGTFSVSSAPRSTLYWRIQVLTADGRSDFSPVWSFRTAVPAPNLVSSSQLSGTINVDTARIEWSLIDDGAAHTTVTGYKVQVARDAAFSSLMVDASLGNSESVYLVPLDATNGIAVDSTYYWRVAAVDADGPSVWTPEPAGNISAHQ